jgi:hypothetical protein
MPDEDVIGDACVGEYGERVVGELAEGVGAG